GTRSLFQYELVLRLCRLFHLAQEFYWYNPSKLPTPAEWVTIRRTRVKDAVNTLWWFAKTTSPQADNRRVLRPSRPPLRRPLRARAVPPARPPAAPRTRPPLPPRQRRCHPTESADHSEHPLQRRVLPSLPAPRPADPPGALSARVTGILHSLPDRAAPARR